MIRKDNRIQSIYLERPTRIEGLSLDFPKNKNSKLAEVHILTGSNGCGKSAVLNELQWLPAKPRVYAHKSTEQNISAEFAIILDRISEIKIKELLALKDGETEKAMGLRLSLNCAIEAVNKITDDNLALTLNSDTLEVLIKRGNKVLPVDAISSGLMSVIVLIFGAVTHIDSWGFEMPNTPALERPLTLIFDEIANNLHPKWQRKVLPVVQKLFPNAQIFVSTHSPFVVGSVQDAWVYKLDDAKTNKRIDAIPSGAGTSYEVLLEDVFGVDERFDVDTQRLLLELRTRRNDLIKNPRCSDVEFKRIAQQLAERSEELNRIVALELRQLAATRGEYL